MFKKHEDFPVQTKTVLLVWFCIILIVGGVTARIVCNSHIDEMQLQTKTTPYHN